MNEHVYQGTLYLKPLHGFGQGILAYRAGTKKKLKKRSFFMFYACVSLQNMQKCIAIHFCFPFIEGKCLFLTLHKKMNKIKTSVLLLSEH
jgi:hypothetical protein